MKRSAADELKIDVLVDSDQWHAAAAAKARVRHALEQAAGRLSTKAAEVAVVLTDDLAVRRLNRTWRGVDSATNVLAFPARMIARARFAPQRAADRDGTQGHPFRIGLCNHLGDIVLAYETVEREARRDGKPFDHHLAHLVVHGFLHLLGYDHVNDAQARRMETAERAILRDLAVPDPYRTNSSAAGHAGKRPAKRPRRDRARPAENA